MNGGPSYPGAGTNAVPSQPQPVSTYSAGAAGGGMASGPSAAPSKGPLAHKYPSYSQPASTSYGGADPGYNMSSGGYGETTTTYNPLDYSQPSQQPYSYGLVLTEL